MDLSRAVETKLARAREAVAALFRDEYDAAMKLGHPLTSLRRALHPEDDPPRKQSTLEKRLDALGESLLARAGVCDAWWETGEGPMRCDPPAPPPAAGPGGAQAIPASEFRGAPGTPTGPPSGYTRIPMVTIEPAASDNGNELDVEIEEVEGDTWLPDWFIRSEYGMDPERIRHVRVRGDSMRDTILPGQRLVIGLVPFGHVISDGHVYVFRGPGGVLIKRLYVEPDHIHVWSDNKKAPRYRVPLEVFSRDYRIAAVALEINTKL